jgi:hypothetical protein
MHTQPDILLMLPCLMSQGSKQRGCVHMTAYGIFDCVAVHCQNITSSESSTMLSTLQQSSNDT